MYQAKIIADSVAKHTKDRITTLEITYPRIIHAEMCRHRNQGRNSASSRAIPVSHMIDRALNDTFLPTVIGKNQAGMSASEFLEGEDYDEVIDMIQEAAEWNADFVRRLSEKGVHKQTANRYIEAFQWHTEILTATTWSNFFALRISPFAQPEINQIATLMKNAIDDSIPKAIEWGDWHLPLVTDTEREEFGLVNAKKVSLARCSRVSYNRHNTIKDLEEDIAQYDRLVSNGHWSCAEHPATPANGQHAQYYGWKPLRKFFPNENDYSKVGSSD